MKFTDKKIQNLKPKPQRYEIWEGNGFGVRVTPRGTRSFVCLFRFEGKPRRLTLGTYPGMTLADAHKAHAEALKKLEQGIDPGAVTVAERREERVAPTVEDLAEEYLRLWARPRKRSWAVDQRILNKDILPIWGRRKARDITRRDVIQLLDKVAERGGIMANRTKALLHKMYAFAVTRDLVPVSPCMGVQAPAPENRRDRVVSAEEIKHLWIGLDHTHITPAIRLALKFMLTTGQRKGEVVSLQWADIDLDGGLGWWRIPPERSKNGLPHRVPLSDLAIELLKAAKTLASDSPSPWIFYSLRRNGPIAGASVDHALRLALKTLEMEHFTPHDLRRTAATNMASMGIPSSVIGKVLNHIDRTVTAIHYNHYDYAREKQMALHAWGRKLQAIVEGTETTKVIPLARGG